MAFLKEEKGYIGYQSDFLNIDLKTKLNKSFRIDNALCKKFKMIT